MRASEKAILIPDDQLATLRNCRGYYECPKDANGKRLVLLVVYAKQYEPGKNYVGDIYLNCARAERYPHVLRDFARKLASEIRTMFERVDWIMGVPDGGRSFGLMLAEELDCEYVYPDVEKVGGEGQRKETIMKVGRHEIEPHTRGLIVEDVCNNFSSTDKVFKLVESQSAEAVGVGCVFNRSGQDAFNDHGLFLPVLAVQKVAAAQYRHDDPFVAEDIETGNVVYEVKKNWARLERAMAAHATA